MSLFLVIFFAIYGGMHVYIYLKLRLLFSISFWRRVFAAFLCLMVLVPIAVRMAERRGFADLSVLTAWIGYLWMGFAFIVIVFLALFDLFILAVAIRQRFTGRKLDENLKLKWTFIVVLAAVICTGYGFCEALLIRTEHITLRTPKIPGNAPQIRIVQISDVHVGVMIGKWRLKRMLDAVAAAKPDILVATGDIVDGQIHRKDGLSSLFKGVKPRYGSFAVFGNHEFYVGLDNSIHFLNDSGFRILRNESVDLFPYLRIAGVDDTPVHSWGQVAGSDERALFPHDLIKPYTILLKHRPTVDPESMGKLDLQLSGHVHKGQIFPFNFLTWLSFPVKSGINRLTDGFILYVSRGTGTWGPPIRFLAPPEVTVIDILPEKSR
jgi:predicted MPP superfamily phosphohydrolase